jgi:alkylation response protein AidB-like acyl-CoA dehydrogenase
MTELTGGSDVGTSETIAKQETGSGLNSKHETLNSKPGAWRGVRNITPVLNTTRLWNGISAASLMRRSIALALDYSHKRSAFGALLSEKPLHVDTLAGLQAEAEGAFHLAFLVAELTGRAETNEIDEEQSLLLK